MKDPKKAKWILGGSGIVLSALILTQFSNAEEENNETAYTQQGEADMSEREKELVNLDWTKFEIVTNNPQQTPIQNDRKTRRS